MPESPDITRFSNLAFGKGAPFKPTQLGRVMQSCPLTEVAVSSHPQEVNTKCFGAICTCAMHLILDNRPIPCLDGAREPLEPPVWPNSAHINWCGGIRMAIYSHNRHWLSAGVYQKCSEPSRPFSGRGLCQNVLILPDF